MLLVKNLTRVDHAYTLTVELYISSVHIQPVISRTFVCISHSADGSQRDLLQRCHILSDIYAHYISLSYLPGSQLRLFHRDASPALLHLVSRWMDVTILPTYSLSIALRYRKPEEKNSSCQDSNPQDLH